MPLLHHDLADFTKATISNFKKLKWTDISLQYPDYESSMLIDDNKVVEWGGDYIKFDVQTRNTGLARNTGLYATDQTGAQDVLQQGQVPWTKQTANYSYDIDEPGFQGDDRETIVRILKLKEHSCMNDIAELDEENLWTAPTGTSDNRPMGIPFWIQKDATTTPGGAFNGGNPSGFTSGAANINSSTYSRWKNWTFGYTNVTADDLISKIKKSLWSTNFKAPHPHPELGWGKVDFCIYTTYRVQEPMERLAESRNDNLGKDLAKYLNAVTVGGVPVKAVHYLEANDTSDPVYGVNFGKFRPFVKKGMPRRGEPEKSATQHTVFTVHIDNWMNYVCFNRRMQWVGSKS
jgi:hypothetical protein